jgi:hypothetical protein
MIETVDRHFHCILCGSYVFRETVPVMPEIPKEIRVLSVDSYAVRKREENRLRVWKTKFRNGHNSEIEVIHANR